MKEDNIILKLLLSKWYVTFAFSQVCLVLNILPRKR